MKSSQREKQYTQSGKENENDSQKQKTYNFKSNAKLTQSEHEPVRSMAGAWQCGLNGVGDGSMDDGGVGEMTVWSTQWESKVTEGPKYLQVFSSRGKKDLRF